MNSFMDMMNKSGKLSDAGKKDETGAAPSGSESEPANEMKDPQQDSHLKNIHDSISAILDPLGEREAFDASYAFGFSHG